MLLIGQYDSPFVRRVGIALRLYGLRFDHETWSVFRDADRIAAHNPLRRVPTLVLEDGEVVVDSPTILDHLDEAAGPERALLPRHGEARRRQLRTTALATGAAEKAVSLFYEGALHAAVSDTWVARCRTQIAETLDVLEAERAALTTPWWHGETIGHADIAVACTMRFVRDVHPDLVDAARWPSLMRHADACEAMPVFQEIAQAFSPPA